MALSYEETAVRLLADVAERYPDKEFPVGYSLNVFIFDDSHDPIDKFHQGKAIFLANQALIGLKIFSYRTTVEDFSEYVHGHAREVSRLYLSRIGKAFCKFPKPAQKIIFWSYKHYKKALALVGALAFVTLLVNAVKGLQFLLSVGNSLASVVVVAITYICLMRLFNSWK